MKHYRKGQIVLLDCGYCGMDDTRECRLIEDARETSPLFENSKPALSARVEIMGTGEVFLAVLPPL
jgi:hypothetical protein